MKRWFWSSGRKTGSYPETGLWEVRTKASNYRPPENTAARHNKPEKLVLPFRKHDAGSLRLGLCARGVLNLEDRVRGRR